MNSAYNALISDLKGQIQNRDARTNELQAKLREYESRTSSLEERVEKDQRAFDELQQSLSELQGHKTIAETEIGRLKSTYDALVSDLKRQIRENDTQAAGFQGKLSDLKRQIRERDIQAAGLQGRLSDLKKELQREYAQTAELQEQISGLNGQTREKDGQTVGLQERITDLVKQGHEKDMRAAGLQEKISDLNRQIQEMDAQTALLQKKLKGHQSLMLSLREKLGEDQTEFKELRQYLSEIEEQKVSAEAEVGQLKSTYDALISDLNKQVQKKEITIREFEEKLSITFVDRILFKSGWANVTPEGNEILKKVGEILKNVQNRDIRVVGHTDNIPLRQEYRDRYPTNWELSSARAAAVVRYFQWKSGIDPGNLEAVGSSFYHPIAGNETEEGRAQNRRVEIVIAPKLK